MSAICHGFVQNAWRRDICSNCFRLREEHSELNLYSGHYQQNGGKSSNQNNSHSISILVKDSSMNGVKSSSGRYQSPTTGIPRVSSMNKYTTSSRSNNNHHNNNTSSSLHSDHLKGGNKSVGNGHNESTLNSSDVIRVGLSNGKKCVAHPLKGDKEIHSNRNVNNSLNGTSPPSSTINGGSTTKHSSTPSPHYTNNHQSNANNSSHSVTNENMTNGNTKRTNATSSAPSSVPSQTKTHSQPPRTTTTTTPQHKSWSSTQSNGKNSTLTNTTGPVTKMDGHNTMDNIKSVVNRPLQSSKIDQPDCDPSDSFNKSPLTNGNVTKRYKGILKAMDSKKRKLSVKFPEEVCKVIGYGGIDEECVEEDDEEVPDPQDSVSIAELMATNSTTNEEKEINRQTVKNTNFNSIKTNLLGYAPIIPIIVGCTGGKSMESSSKPLVSIGTFEARKEPLKIRKSEDFVVGGEDKEVVGKGPKMTGNNNTGNSQVTKTSSTLPPAVESKVTKLQGIPGDNVVVNVKNTNTTTTTTPKGRQSSGGGNDVKINGKDIVEQTNGISTIQVNPEKSAIKLNPVITTSTSLTTTAPSQVERPKPKPILKNNSLQNNGGDTGRSENNKNCDKPENALSNLIILNGGNITTTKRTSFLQEIISTEPVTVLTSPTEMSKNSDNHLRTSKITPVNEITSLNLDGDSLETIQNSQVPKANIKINPKLNHLKSYEFEDNASEFDDSLEDSGLDIGGHDKSTTRVENSESDDNDTEKFGSSSDSGNENDYNERIVVPKGGLYISVDDDGKITREDSTKPKLSPDSVLFSSASSGSSESIPECVNRHVISSSPVKRTAPLPPPVPVSQSIQQIPDYQSGHVTHESDQNDVYDDVGTYQQSRRVEPEEEDQEEESIYDDCTTATPSNGKSVTGSYDFTNGTRTSLDTDEIDKIPLRPSDGIEFIGIRKIDSETHLNTSIPSKPRSPSPENAKRSSSVSPKARRKVNQFFSTIGKKAGAAFSSHNPLSGSSGSGFLRNKSPSPITTNSSVTGYKRSLSQDEVSMTRTQEIYATITPTSLKFKGLAPVLQKLSRMDMDSAGKEENPKEKMFKKHKILPSIRNFLRMGSKNGEMSGGDKSYDFKTELKHSDTNLNGDSSSSICASSESSSNPPSLDDTISDKSRSSTLTNSTVNSTTTSVKPVIAARPIAPLGRPPPPPPRVHSLDLLNKVGVTSSGTGSVPVKPARPPPPVRSNRIAPSFVSVFAAQEDESLPRDFSDKVGTGPPNKPKRKASMNCHTPGNSIGTRNDEDSSMDSNVINLKFELETLKLIASHSQVPKKIKRKSSYLVKFSASPIRWSQFYVSSVEPMAQGDRFAFYSALWEDEPCVLLLQEPSDEFPLLQFKCVEISAKFDDFVPMALVPWSASEYAEDCTDIKVSISVLPSCTIQRMSNYINSRSYSSLQKYFALLLSLDYWGMEEMNDLLVFQGGSPDEETAEDSELVYVVPITHNKSKRPPSYTQLSSNFEISIKQLLLRPHILSEDDRQALFRLISGTNKEVQAQLKLFLQAKLFSQKIKTEDLEKLRRNKSEHVFYQKWMEKERALAMHEAIERTLRNEPITPLKKTFVELLLIPSSSAKAMIEMLLDIIN